MRTMKRKYFSDDFNAENWETLRMELEKMKNNEIGSVEDLMDFIQKYGELSAILNEVMAWKYIDMTRFMNDPGHKESYQCFVEEIGAKTDIYFSGFDRMIYNSPYAVELSEYYHQMLKIISNDIKIFREKNVPLFVDESKRSNLYEEQLAILTIMFEGSEYTITQMLKFIIDPDRKKREIAWRLISKKIAEERSFFDELFDELKKIRIEIAQNAGFKNYRDYIHQKKGREYSIIEIFQLHESVRKIIVPFLREMNEKRKKELNVDSLRPWDFYVHKEFVASSFSRTLKPFDNAKTLTDRALKILEGINPEFANILNRAISSGCLDLESRKGKALGGYNLPLEESFFSFIFMNVVGIHDDVRGFFHEFGHLMQTIKKCNHNVAQYRTTPQEIGEMAAMSMELMVLDGLSEYYPNNEDFREAKKEMLIRTLDSLPWIMIIDAFQHWIYLNPNHTPEERADYFDNLMQKFNTGRNWSGFEGEKKAIWMSQPHVFVAPFYFIEYAIAQLGAIAFYKNFKENKEKAVKKYIESLMLGSSKSIQEVYEAAGIKFDFSENYIREMVNFIRRELKQLE